MIQLIVKFMYLIFSVFAIIVRFFTSTLNIQGGIKKAVIKKSKANYNQVTQELKPNSHALMTLVEVHQALEVAVMVGDANAVALYSKKYEISPNTLVKISPEFTVSLLTLAFYYGDRRVIEILTSRGYGSLLTANYMEDVCVSPLGIVSILGDTDLLDYFFDMPDGEMIIDFLKKGYAYLQTPITLGNRPLYLASLFGHVEMVRSLLRYCKAEFRDLEVADNDAVYQLILDSNRSYFLRHFSQNNQFKGKVENALRIHCSKQRSSSTTKVVKDKIIKFRQEMDLRLKQAKLNFEMEQRKPLLFPIPYKNINFLLSSNRRVNPVFYAIQENRIQQVEQYIENKGDVDLGETILSGYTPFMNLLVLACLYKREEIVRLLIDAKADVNARCDSGLTALLIAIDITFEAAVRLLLIAGADPNLSSTDGLIEPLTLACERGNTRIIELLLRYKANPNALSANGASAFQRTVIQGSFAHFKLLIDHGGTLTTLIQEDKDGDTCYSLANALHRDDFIQFMDELQQEEDNRIKQAALRLQREREQEDDILRTEAEHLKFIDDGYTKVEEQKVLADNARKLLKSNLTNVLTQLREIQFSNPKAEDRRNKFIHSVLNLEAESNQIYRHILDCYHKIIEMINTVYPEYQDKTKFDAFSINYQQTMAKMTLNAFKDFEKRLEEYATRFEQEKISLSKSIVKEQAKARQKEEEAQKQIELEQKQLEELKQKAEELNRKRLDNRKKYLDDLEKRKAERKRDREKKEKQEQTIQEQAQAKAKSQSCTLTQEQKSKQDKTQGNDLLYSYKSKPTPLTLGVVGEFNRIVLPKEVELLEQIIALSDYKKEHEKTVEDLWIERNALLGITLRIMELLKDVSSTHSPVPADKSEHFRDVLSHGVNLSILQSNRKDILCLDVIALRNFTLHLIESQRNCQIYVQNEKERGKGKENDHKKADGKQFLELKQKGADSKGLMEVWNYQIEQNPSVRDCLQQIELGEKLLTRCQQNLSLPHEMRQAAEGFIYGRLGAFSRMLKRIAYHKFIERSDTLERYIELGKDFRHVLSSVGALSVAAEQRFTQVAVGVAAGVSAGAC